MNALLEHVPINERAAAVDRYLPHALKTWTLPGGVQASDEDDVVAQLMNCSLPTMPIFLTPRRWAAAMTAATLPYSTSLLGLMCTSD